MAIFPFDKDKSTTTDSEYEKKPLMLLDTAVNSVNTVSELATFQMDRMLH